MFCRCGRLLTLNRQHGGRYLYLRCRGRLEGHCPHRDEPLIRYDEEKLIRVFMGQRWAEFFHRPADSATRRNLQSEILEAEQLHHQQLANAATAEATMGQLLSSGTLDPGTANLIGAKVREAQAQAAATAERLQGLHSRLLQLEAQPTGATIQQQIRERVRSFLDGLQHDPAERRRFNAWLSTLGVQITLSQGPGTMLQMAVDRPGAVEYHPDRVVVPGAEIHVMGVPKALWDVLWDQATPEPSSPLRIRSHRQLIGHHGGIPEQVAKTDAELDSGRRHVRSGT
jgi:hypothetical protein